MGFIKGVFGFNEELSSLTLWEFENLIFDLVKERFSANDVELNSSSGRDLGFDIKAKSDDLTIYVEVKKRSLLNVDEIARLGNLWSRLSDEPKTKLIFAISGNLSNAASEKIKEFNIEVWDVWKLYDIISDKLERKYFYNGLTESGSKIEKQSTEEIFIETLKSISTGDEKRKNEWAKYQKLISDIFEHLYSPPLGKPKYELPDLDKKNRRDVIFENSAESGYWKLIRETYSGDYIVLDAKNYSKGIGKRQVVDIAHYLKPYGVGMFGLLVSRKEESEASLFARKEQWIGSRKMIISLNDDDIEEMLRIKESGGKPEEIIRKQNH